MGEIKFRGLTTKEWSSRTIQGVLQFYLFECPAPGASRAAKDFASLGWNGTYFSTLKAEMLHVAGNGFAYLPCRKDELSAALLDRPAEKTTAEYAIFLKNDERQVISSLFKAIRNAIAHGSFARYSHSKCIYYYFENEDRYVKARINVKEETLLSWARVIKEHPEAVRSRVRGRG